MATVISEITSPAIAWYIHLFVEWNDEAEYYSSYNDMKRHKEKVNELNDIILLGASNDELEFLYRVEQDPKIKKRIERIKR